MPAGRRGLPCAANWFTIATQFMEDIEGPCSIVGRERCKAANEWMEHSLGWPFPSQTNKHMYNYVLAFMLFFLQKVI